jgi:hypothetical protein
LETPVTAAPRPASAGPEWLAAKAEAVEPATHAPQADLLTLPG